MVLYSTNCPKCKILENKMKQKQIDFEVCSDTEKMLKMGFQSAPMLEVNGEILNFQNAISFVNNSK